MFAQSLNMEYESVYETCIDKTQETLDIVVCLRCGRPLTNEKSRLARLGPKCARKILYETRTGSFSAKTLQHHQSILRTSQAESIPTQTISLYYDSCSSNRPYCNIGTVSLPATESCTVNTSNYRKKSYSLPLVEKVIFDIGVCLPGVRTLRVQVRDQQLIEISNVIR